MADSWEYISAAKVVSHPRRSALGSSRAQSPVSQRRGAIPPRIEQCHCGFWSRSNSYNPSQRGVRWTPLERIYQAEKFGG